MEPQKFFYPVLESLDEGGLMRTIWAAILRCVGVLIALGGIYAFVEVLRLSFKADKAEITIAGLILAIGVLAAATMILQIYFYRAGCIRDLPASRFTVIPIFSIMLRTAGEVYAVLAAVLGVAGCFFLWFTSMSPSYMLGGIGDLLPSGFGGGTFLDGLTFAFACLVVAMAVLILAYFFAESIVVLADIATNMNMLAYHWVPDAHESSGSPAAAPIQQRRQRQEPPYSNAPVDAQPSYGVYAQQQAGQNYGEQTWQNPEPARSEPIARNQAPAAPAYEDEPTRRQAAPDYAPSQTWPAQQPQAPVAPPAAPQGQAPPASREPRSRIRIVQRCRNCGAELGPGTTNCPNCGTAV